MTTTKNRYATKFAQLKSENSKAFIPFTMLGYPDKNQCLASMQTFAASGASALELGLAFSDPMADGPTIQQAANETIDSGFTVADAFALISEFRKINDDIPIGLLVYYNMILKFGIEKFYQTAAANGIDGVLIADLPPECASEVAEFAKASSVQQIYIVSPLTDSKRLTSILQYAGGFIYAVSRLGVTGVEERYDTQLKTLIERVKSATDLPICVGFGISNPQQASTMCELGADGVITGSKIIEIIRTNESTKIQSALSEFVLAMVAVVTKFGLNSK